MKFNAVDSFLQLRTDLSNLEKVTGKPQTKAITFVNEVLGKILKGEVEMDDERFGVTKTVLSELTSKDNGFDIDVSEVMLPDDDLEDEPLQDTVHTTTIEQLDWISTQEEMLNGDFSMEANCDGEPIGSVNLSKFITEVVINAMEGNEFVSDGTQLGDLLERIANATMKRVSHYLNQQDFEDDSGEDWKE